MFPVYATDPWSSPWASFPAKVSKLGLIPFRKADRADEFDALALPFMDDLFRMALRMTRDRGRAEDAVQEAYLQAWKSFDRFEPGTNIRAWLYKVLFNCVHHQRRKWLRFPGVSDSELVLEQLPSSPPPATDHLTDSQILAALDDIPEDYRAVVLLVDVEEFPYKEAAEILHVPIGTVMSRLSRGRKALRERLEDTARAYGVVK